MDSTETSARMLTLGPVTAKAGDRKRVAYEPIFLHGIPGPFRCEKLVAVEAIPGDARPSAGLRTRILRAWVDDREVSLTFPNEALRIEGADGLQLYDGPMDGSTAMFAPRIVGNGLSWPACHRRIEVEVEFLEDATWTGCVLGTLSVKEVAHG